LKFEEGTMTENALILIPTPERIAANLESIAQLIDEGGERNIKLVKRMLGTAASNVRLLFELDTDPETGEFRLKNYGQAWMLADLLSAGKMVPSSYDSPEQVVIGLMKATEIGVSPITGLANIMIVNNRPSVWGDLAQALVERSGQVAKQVKEEIGEKPTPGLELSQWSDTYGWRVSTWRKNQDEPYVGVYTVAQAKRAKLWMNANKKPWITDPEQMLFNRARARSLRDGFADCLLGMGIVEEQADFQSAPIDLQAHGDQGALPSPDAEPVTEITPQTEATELREYPGTSEAAERKPAREQFDEARAEAGIGEDGDPPTLV
jgi:hypothetical protein